MLFGDDLGAGRVLWWRSEEGNAFGEGVKVGIVGVEFDLVTNSSVLLECLGYEIELLADLTLDVIRVLRAVKEQD